jgi:hypothetical protein
MRRKHDPRQLTIPGFGPPRPGFTTEQTALIEAALDWDLDYLNRLDRETLKIPVPLGKRYDVAVVDVMRNLVGWSSGVTISRAGLQVGTLGVHYGARSFPAYDRVGAYYWRDVESAWSAAAADFIRLLAGDFNDPASAERARAYLLERERWIAPITPPDAHKVYIARRDEIAMRKAAA